MGQHVFFFTFFPFFIALLSFLFFRPHITLHLQTRTAINVPLEQDSDSGAQQPADRRRRGYLAVIHEPLFFLYAPLE